MSEGISIPSFFKRYASSVTCGTESPNSLKVSTFEKTFLGQLSNSILKQ